jgi:hypothetical protein
VAAANVAAANVAAAYVAATTIAAAGMAAPPGSVGNGRKYSQGQHCRPNDEYVFHAVFHLISLTSGVLNLD